MVAGGDLLEGAGTYIMCTLTPSCTIYGTPKASKLPSLHGMVFVLLPPRGLRGDAGQNAKPICEGPDVHGGARSAAGTPGEFTQKGPSAFGCFSCPSTVQVCPIFEQGSKAFASHHHRLLCIPK